MCVCACVCVCVCVRACMLDITHRADSNYYTTEVLSMFDL